MGTLTMKCEGECGRHGLRTICSRSSLPDAKTSDGLQSCIERCASRQHCRAWWRSRCSAGSLTSWASACCRLAGSCLLYTSPSPRD
eukprot:11801231-Alexandrium_andersonii.AAC.1